MLVRGCWQRATLKPVPELEPWTQQQALRIAPVNRRRAAFLIPCGTYMRALCFTPHFAISASTGTRVRPYGVNEYSTPSHLFAEARRHTILSSSSSFNCCVATFRVASGISRSSFPNRSGFRLRAFTIIGFHFPLMTSAVTLTEHSDNFIFIDAFSYKKVRTGRVAAHCQ